MSSNAPNRVPRRVDRRVWWILVVMAAGIVAALVYRARGSATDGMVRLPGGAFTMGTRGDQALVRAFWLDRTEVTVDAYGDCVSAGRCKPARSKRQPCTSGLEGGGTHPINCVSWQQARTYCAWKGKRLPSEEEWEWAARGTKAGTPYPWGKEGPEGRACWNRTGKPGTCPVGSFPSGASPQGIVDLAGNVWEWTASVYRQGSKMRVFRGGGWPERKAKNLRADTRVRFLPGGRSGAVGFRCALSMKK